jgi:phage gpG-like protein
VVVATEWNTASADNALDSLTAALGQVIDRAGSAFVASTMKAAPVETGALRRSIQGHRNSATEFVYGSNLVYAHIQDQGGVIHVKVKKVLANRREGIFFGKQVTMPAQQYMQKGGEEGIEDATARVAAYLQEHSGG